MNETFKASLRKTLQQFGLYEIARKLSKGRNPYKHVKRYEAEINDVVVLFRTDDEYSNSWFYPRYANGGIHEKVVTEMLVDDLKNAKCFIDIGTNLGWYTCVASRHMPEGKVYGFEMDELNFELLKNNIALNNCENVEVHIKAVSDSNGEVRYRRETNQPNPGLSMEGTKNSAYSGRIVSVKSVAMDSFLADKAIVPDIMKIDVEGAEMSVLKGMTETLRTAKPTLFLEVHPSKLPAFETSMPEILALLFAADYEVYEIEDMRIQESRKHMRRLQEDSIVGENTMLYVTPQAAA